MAFTSEILVHFCCARPLYSCIDGLHFWDPCPLLLCEAVGFICGVSSFLLSIINIFLLVTSMGGIWYNRKCWWSWQRLIEESTDANRDYQMETLTMSMTELSEKTLMIAQARVPHAQQELTKNLGMNAVRCQDATDKMTRLIENCWTSRPAFRNNQVNIPL